MENDEILPFELGDEIRVYDPDFLDDGEPVKVAAIFRGVAAGGRSYFVELREDGGFGQNVWRRVARDMMFKP